MIGLQARVTARFDGHDITDGFVMSALSRPRPVRVARAVEVDGMRGSALTASGYGPIEVEMRLAAVGDPASRRERVDRLMAGLDVGEARPLSFSDDAGRYYMAVPSGGGAVAHTAWSDEVSLVFLVPDPARYGAERSVALASGSTATVRVGGNTEAALRVAATAARASGGVWGVTCDGGDAVKVEMGSGAHSVEIDCERRTAAVDSQAAVPTLASDWIAMAPGTHQISMTGTGAATAMWTERWL